MDKRPSDLWENGPPVACNVSYKCLSFILCSTDEKYISGGSDLIEVRESYKLVEHFSCETSMKANHRGGNIA